MGLLEEYQVIIKKEQRVVKSHAIELRSALIKRTPVGNPSIWEVNAGLDRKDYVIPKGYRGGNLKASWTSMKPIKDGFVFTNTAIYADSIFEGRRTIRGKTFGSKQMLQSENIHVILKQSDRDLQNKLKAIK